MSYELRVKNRKRGIRYDTAKTRNSLFPVYNSRAGFTLIELLVTIGITVMMLSIFISFNARSRRSISLLTEKAKIAQMILQAKSKAILTGKQPSPPYFCGYGFYVNYAAQSYEVFKYTVPDAVDCKANTLSAVGPGQGYERLQELSFQANPDLTLISNPPDQDAIRTVLFIPPDPKTLIWLQDGSTNSDGKIYLQIKGSSEEGMVKVNNGGQVSY